MVRTRGSLMAVQQDRGSSPIEVWDTGSGQLLGFTKGIEYLRQKLISLTMPSPFVMMPNLNA